MVVYEIKFIVGIVILLQFSWVSCNQTETYVGREIEQVIMIRNKQPFLVSKNFIGYPQEVLEEFEGKPHFVSEVNGLKKVVYYYTHFSKVFDEGKMILFLEVLHGRRQYLRSGGIQREKTVFNGEHQYILQDDKITKFIDLEYEKERGLEEIELSPVDHLEFRDD